MFNVYYFDATEQQWLVAKTGLPTFAAASCWAAQFETRSLRSMVRRERKS